MKDNQRVPREKKYSFFLYEKGTPGRRVKDAVSALALKQTTFV